MWTGREVYARIFEFWKHIFAVVFGMGVVSGIVMSYQFGTNWAVFSDRAGPIIGPLMGYEVLSAFFLEAGFLGILLFGRKRVSPKIYMGATLMVAIGTFASAFWILSVNSWMQTPQGYAINEVGQFVPEDEFAQYCGMSRTPVREAIAELVAELLLQRSDTNRVFVPVWTDADAEELFALRAMLESHCARRAARFIAAASMPR